jgi:hypothetical protein
MPLKGQKMSSETRQKISESWRKRPRLTAEQLAESAEKRFAKSVKEGPIPEARPDLGPCLLFTGAKSNGYGQFRYEERNGYAHRYAWERENGPIPDGLTVDHLCRVRHCVRVSHFELVDAVTNYMRAVAVRDKCPNGHPYTADNLRTYRGGRRRCVTCMRKQHEIQKRKRSRSLNGLPNRRIKYDQTRVSEVIASIRAAETTIAQGAREIGCHPNYLGRRVWNETRQDVLERDGHQCAKCGERAGDVHHRRRRGTGGSSKPKIAFGWANLISLCRLCHSWVHASRAESLEMGLVLEEHDVPAEVPVLHFIRGSLRLLDGGTVMDAETGGAA